MGDRRTLTKNGDELDRHKCLAWEVLQQPAPWLGQVRPVALQTFLLGASYRAGHAMHNNPNVRIPSWHVFGPLYLRAFDKPLVDRTGHATLSIRWPRALELLHFSMDSAMDELRFLVDAFFDEARESACVGAAKRVNLHGTEDDFEIHRESFDPHWPRLAKRPGMYIGASRGEHLQWFLTGMTTGADWLGLPAYPRALNIRRAIEAQSQEAYGSPFGAYRVEATDARKLLSWAEVIPQD